MRVAPIFTLFPFTTIFWSGVKIFFGSKNFFWVQQIEKFFFRSKNFFWVEKFFLGRKIFFGSKKSKNFFLGRKIFFGSKNFFWVEKFFLGPKNWKIFLWVEQFFLGRKIERKRTRLNSSHKPISYAVFCSNKKNTHITL